MVNRPKAIGTAGETAVRNHFLKIGIPEKSIHRNVLAGAQDQGDLWLRLVQSTIVIEVKAGHAAENASHEQMKLWMREAVLENEHANGIRPVLVTKRKAVGAARAGEWWAYTPIFGISHRTMMRCTLDEMIQHFGWGNDVAGRE